MEGKNTISVPMPTDENGLVGRECPSCGMYFKLKLGTGLPISQCSCPYCSYEDESNEFMSQDQKDYFTSIAAREFLAPILRDFANSVNHQDTWSNSLIQIKISVTVPEFRIQYYQEKILETNVTCDNCGLVFSIYGVFSNCPDCGRLNARVIYEKSLDASNGKLRLSEDNTIEEVIREEFIKDALKGSVSAFDALGKALRTKHSEIPGRPPNLFQNFLKLDEVLVNITGKHISQFLTPEDSNFLFLMFQVRHIYEHSAGVIDNDFVSKLPAYAHQLGRKYPLKKEDIKLFIALMRKLGDAIYKEFEN